MNTAAFTDKVEFGGDVTLTAAEALTLSTTNSVLTLADGKTIAGVIKADGGQHRGRRGGHCQDASITGQTATNDVTLDKTVVFADN
ncbi:MAG: hypothetical protein LBO04_05385 [Spirochaetaceae bacterium]|nr:hypothetical protein [Spirochaetaceae bacterium]